MNDLTLQISDVLADHAWLEFTNKCICGERPVAKDMLLHRAVKVAELLESLAEHEYAWEADETVRQTMSPRGPRILIDGYISTPEEIANFPKGRRIYRTKAGPWLPVEEP